MSFNQNFVQTEKQGAMANGKRPPHSEVEIAFADCSRQFVCRNTSGDADELPLIYFVLDKRDGTPIMLKRRNKENALFCGMTLSFQEFQELARLHSSYNRYEDLSEQNWYEYTIYRPGDQIQVYGESSGTGPYHDETRLGLQVNENGYTLFYQEISPMGGGCSECSKLPFGSFQEKTMEDINELFRSMAKYVPGEKINIGQGAYEQLLRTDAYRSAQQNSILGGQNYEIETA